MLCPALCRSFSSTVRNDVSLATRLMCSRCKPLYAMGRPKPPNKVLSHDSSAATRPMNEPMIRPMDLNLESCAALFQHCQNFDHVTSGAEAIKQGMVK